MNLEEDLKVKEKTQKESAVTSYKSVNRKLEKANSKYKDLKGKGKLSPIDEGKCKEKIQKLKKNKGKTRLQM